MTDDEFVEFRIKQSHYIAVIHANELLFSVKNKVAMEANEVAAAQAQRIYSEEDAYMDYLEDTRETLGPEFADRLKREWSVD